MVKKSNPRFLLLVFSLSLLTETCSSQNNAPLTQNLTIVAIRLWTDAPITINQGRVDLQMTNGAWGSICPNGWDANTTSRNVNTTCAMLGFMNGGNKVANTYGSGNKNFVIENATCPINATSWSQCTQYFAKKCGPQDEELAVVCVPDPRGSNFVQLAQTGSVPGSGGLPPSSAAAVNTVIINGTNTTNCAASTNARLIGGDVVNASAGNGFVQVNINGQWGFVCSETWNQAAAIVVCRELCFESVPGFTPLPGVIAKSVPDQMNRTFALSSINCVGNESSLLACPVINSSAVCSPDTILAGVQCRPNCCDDKPIILPSMNCSTEILIANFTKTKFPLITVNNIYMVNNVPTQCMNVSSNTVGDVLVRVSVASGCGVDLQENSTHITYAVSVRAIWVSGTVVINDYSNVRYDLVCSLPKSYVVTNRMEPYTKAPNITLYQQYNFSLAMDLFTDCNFTTNIGLVGSVYPMEVGQWMNAAISVENYDPRTKLVLTDCDAYPVIPYSAYTPVVKLIQDKCPVDTTLTIYHMDNRREGFQVKAFYFAGYSMVYIRCSVNICLLNSTSPECDRSCKKPLSGRRRRSASNLGSMMVDSKTIFVYNASDSGVSRLVQMLSQNVKTVDETGTSNQNKTTVENNQQQTTGDKQTSPSTPVTNTTTTAQPTSTTTTAQPTSTTTAQPTSTTTTQPTTTAQPTSTTTTAQPTSTTTAAQSTSTTTAQSTSTTTTSAQLTSTTTTAAQPTSTTTTAQPTSTTTTAQPTSTTTTTQPTSTTTTTTQSTSTTTAQPTSTTARPTSTTTAQQTNATTVQQTSTTVKLTSSIVTSKKTYGISTSTHEYPTYVDDEDQQSNNQPELDQYEDPRQHQQTQEQQQQQQQQQQAELGENSSSANIAQKGEVSELKGGDPNSGSFIGMSSVISGVTCAVWLVYVLAGAKYIHL